MKCRSGGIGRRAGFRCLWSQDRVGSSPISCILFYFKCISPPRKSLILRGFSLFIFLLYIKFWKNLPIFCPSLMLRAKTALLSRKFFTYLLYFFHCVYQIHFYSFEHLITITALKTLYLSIFPFISYTGNANTAFAFSFALVPLSLCV